MAKLVSIRTPVLLPFPETKLREEIRKISSMPATGALVAHAIVLSEQCRPYVRIRMRERTSERFVAAELMERLEWSAKVDQDSSFEIEVEALRPCLFVGALKCLLITW